MISSALKRPTQTWDGFVAAFTSRVDMFGKTYLKEHISESVCYFLPYLAISIPVHVTYKSPTRFSKSKKLF